MPVYVDDMWQSPLGRFGRMKMSHMFADTSEELRDMCRKIGFNLKWLQHPGTWKEHVDISLGLRAKAVQAGAVEVTMRDYARMIRNRRLTGSLA